MTLSTTSRTAPLRTRRSFILAAASSAVATLAGACAPGAGGTVETKPSTLAPSSLEVWIVDWAAATKTSYEQAVLPAWQQQQPQVKVDVVWPSWGTMHTELLTRFAAGNPPDVFQHGAAIVPEIAGKNLAVPMDQLLAQWGKKSDFFSAPLVQTTWDGKQYGLPYLVATRTYFYRQDVLSEIGMSKAPVTWEEQLDYARRATKHEEDRLVRAAFGTPTTDEWGMNLYALGGQYYDASRRAIFNRPEYYAALEALVERHSIVQPPGVQPLQGGGTPIVDGRLAAQYNHQAIIRNFVQNAPGELDKLVVGLPSIPGGSRFRAPAGVTPKHYARIYPDWLAIGSATKNRDAAWRFITHLFEPEFLFTYNESLFFLPPTKSVASMNKGYLQHKQMQEMTKVMEQHGGPTGLFPELNRWTEIQNPMFSDAINKKRGVKEVLDDAANLTNALFREIGFAK